MTDGLQTITNIPQFKTREEEATFWDTHDIADLLQEGERVQLQFVPKNKLIAIRFEERTAAQLSF